MLFTLFELCAPFLKFSELVVVANALDCPEFVDNLIEHKMMMVNKNKVIPHLVYDMIFNYSLVINRIKTHPLLPPSIANELILLMQTEKSFEFLNRTYEVIMKQLEHVGSLRVDIDLTLEGEKKLSGNKKITIVDMGGKSFFVYNNIDGIVICVYDYSKGVLLFDKRFGETANLFFSQLFVVSTI